RVHAALSRARRADHRPDGLADLAHGPADHRGGGHQRRAWDGGAPRRGGAAGARMTKLWTAQTLDYGPPLPRSKATEIGLVGCGAITALMLAAYRSAGLNVTALCDPVATAAEARRAAYFPDARVFEDHREMLDATSVEVVDVATHTDVRPEIVADCL